MNIENVKGIEKNHDFWVMVNNGVDLQNRKIYITGILEESYAETCLFAIDYFNSKLHCPNTHTDPITLFINSSGGCIDLMFALYDAITTSPSEIHTIASGHVCSAASLLLVSGDKRSAYENSWVMFHKLSLDLSGHEDEVAAGAEVTKKMASAYWKIIGRHTNLPPGKWLGLVKRKAEVWMTSAELVERGVVDEIIKPVRRSLDILSSRSLNI